MSLTRVFPAMMPLESDTTFWVTSNTAITISKSIADEPDRNSGLKNPAHDEGRLKLRHVVVLGDHLDQLITGDEGQDDACNGQHHIPGEGFDHGEHSRLKTGGLGAHLLGDVAHLRVHIVEQAR